MDLENALWWLRKAYSLLPTKNKSKNQDITKINYHVFQNKDLAKTIKSYYFSSIVTYGKCFTSAKGRGVKLESKDHVKKNLVLP
ncbi:MAG: hypothetical protein KAT05_10465 [Spirochaetes bacterium]|nr:hypothetical protein [Spirochaetota bacterium]